MGRILVTDDDETCRASILRTLEKEGYAVEGATDVEHALEAVQRHPFDLIVCDYRMPGRTGLELLAELRRQGSVIPFLMISGYADPCTESATLQWGGAQLLRKPFRRQQLLDSAEALMLPG
jgi:DNA-binding response OmpR family regulator